MGLEGCVHLKVLESRVLWTLELCEAEACGAEAGLGVVWGGRGGLK